MSHNANSSSSSSSSSSTGSRFRSSDSMGSVGIGEPSALPKYGWPQHDLPTLTPEGAQISTDTVYDSVVYLIYCPQHDKIAVTNIEKCKCHWLPFVVLPPGVTWERASHDGVAILIGRNDAEMSAEEAIKTAPIYTMTYLHMLRLQLPATINVSGSSTGSGNGSGNGSAGNSGNSGRMISRIARFVYLQRNPHFQCCRNTDRVNWLDYADVYHSRIGKIWGPELEIFPRMTWSEPTQVISEFTIKNALYYWQLDSSVEQRLLHDAQLTETSILEIYTDYVEHCYPSFYMCYESFRAYMMKRGGRDWKSSEEVDDSEERLARFYGAFRANSRSFIDFHEFLMGLVLVEPNSNSAATIEARTHFIFRYYDFEQAGTIDARGVIALLKEGYPSWCDRTISIEARRWLANKARLTFDDFIVEHERASSKLAANFCRAPKSILKQISIVAAKQRERRSKEIAAAMGNDTGKYNDHSGKSSDPYACWSCRPQRYEFGNHSVMINTVGRCVDPIIASNPMMLINGDDRSAGGGGGRNDKNVPMSRSKYSLEYVFTIGSMPSIFIDMIRDFVHQKRVASTNNQQQQQLPQGLMTLPEDLSTFVKYLGILCKELTAMLSHEDKLIRINSPALVIGDLQGNITDLFQLEKCFFQSFPVISENLVFLGNYSSSSSGSGSGSSRGSSSGSGGSSNSANSTISTSGIECLIYLFSMKLCSPNKVFLLRGVNELHTAALQRECIRKYGATCGKRVHAYFVDIFGRLPIAVSIDGQIACVHSGIPANALFRLDGTLAKCPKEMRSLERDCPTAYEIVTRYPRISKRPTPGIDAKGGQIGMIASPRDATEKNAENGNNNNNNNNNQNKSDPSRSRKQKQKQQQQEKSNSSKSKTPKSITRNSESDISIDSTITFEINKSVAKVKRAESNESNDSSRLRFQNFQYPPQKTPIKKRKPAFLRSYCIKRKLGTKNRLKPNQQQQQQQQQQQPGKISSKAKRTAFDRYELLTFLRSNDFALLLRSHSWCEEGFRFDFAPYTQRCATIFSNSNFDGRNNQAAVALIDASDCTIRFIRFDSFAYTTTR